MQLPASDTMNVAVSLLAALGVPIFAFIIISFFFVSLKLFSKADDKRFHFRSFGVEAKSLLLCLLMVLFLGLLSFSAMDALGIASSRSSAVKVLAAISIGFVIGAPASIILLFYGKVAHQPV
jgi:hypothetical protein